MSRLHDHNCDYTASVWYGSTAAAATNITVWPGTVSAVAPVVAKARTALEWLRDQIDEITAVAVA